MHEASIIYPLVRESHIEPFNAVYNGVVAVVLDGGSLWGLSPALYCPSRQRHEHSGQHQRSRCKCLP